MVTRLASNNRYVCVNFEDLAKLSDLLASYVHFQPIYDDYTLSLRQYMHSKLVIAMARSITANINAYSTHTRSLQVNYKSASFRLTMVSLRQTDRGLLRYKRRM